MTGKPVIVHHDKSDSASATTTSDPEKNNNGFQQPYVKSPAEKALVRKITYTIMPLVSWIIIVQVFNRSRKSLSL